MDAETRQSRKVKEVKTAAKILIFSLTSQPSLLNLFSIPAEK